ncbi:hypothetical protein VA249_24980 [Vibrio alfacsensis]|uniref:polysaccharide deacetylase family protein n=1 Tax=Vibrio alfacsensis TaxID=1074311 RepID=UPI001BF0451E|nr:polysaccharide deacetylase family protein [Vibrio alfacsensis]BBM65852.1 hypothetical protein VA249_24980 [Vibrio alfacsensis]
MKVNSIVSVLFLFFLFGCKEELIVKEIGQECELSQYIVKGRNIVLSYDDTPIQDYDKLLPLHKKFGIPGEVAIWLNKIEDFSGQPDQLTIQQLLELQDNGFELVSHTTYHTSLGEATLIKKANKGDDKIRTNIDSTFQHASYLSGQYELKGDTIQYIKIKKIGSDEQGTYIQLSKPLLFDFPAYSKLTISKRILEEEVELSNEYLENFGISIEHISYPFGLVDQSTVNFLKGSLKTGRLAIPSRNWEKTDFVYERHIDDEFRINSLDFSHADDAFLENLLSSTEEKDAFIMLFTHSWDEKYTEDKLRTVVELANKYGWKFSTRTEALDLVCQE